MYHMCTAVVMYGVLGSTRWYYQVRTKYFEVHTTLYIVVLGVSYLLATRTERRCMYAYAEINTQKHKFPYSSPYDSSTASTGITGIPVPLYLCYTCNHIISRLARCCTTGYHAKFLWVFRTAVFISYATKRGSE